MILYGNYDTMRAKAPESSERERVSPAHQYRYGKKNTIIWIEDHFRSNTCFSIINVDFLDRPLPPNMDLTKYIGNRLSFMEMGQGLYWT